MRELTVPGTVLQNFLPIIFFSKISMLGTIACHGNQKPDLTIKKGLFCENLAVKGFMHSSNTNAYLSVFFFGISRDLFSRRWRDQIAWCTYIKNVCVVDVRLSDKTLEGPSSWHPPWFYFLIISRVSDTPKIYLLDYWPLLAEVVQCCLTLEQDVLTCFESLTTKRNVRAKSV